MTRKPKAKKNPVVPLATAAGEFMGNVQTAKAARTFMKTGKLKFNKGSNKSRKFLTDEKGKALPDASAWFAEYLKTLNAKSGAKGKRKNPAVESAEAFQDFHGRPSDETVVVEREIHYHRHLAAAGKLEQLIVVSRAGDRVTLSRFKGAMLCFNEKRTQLFVEGGDQEVNLREFGIAPASAHEIETLGDVVQVDYFTRKDHLGKDGGVAIYQHKFHKPYPELVYDVVNQQLTFSGGKYVILPEGIDK